MKGLMRELGAVSYKSVHILEQRNLAADLLKLQRAKIAGSPHDIGGSFGLDAGAIVNDLGFEVILEPAEAPIADIVLVKMAAGWAELFDDGFIGETVIEHMVDLVAERGGQAGDLAVTTGPGLAGLELEREIVFS